MQFLYPIGLLALAGLIIPLLIHLWNVKKGKTLKIGSISLLGESSHASSRSFKINDWFLLLLRCLLLMLLAFLLAQPFIKKSSSEKIANHWILVDQTKLAQVYQEHRTTIDSLLKNGYTIHDFNIGFNQLSLSDTSNALHQTRYENASTYKTLTYTSLLHQLNEVIPGTSVYLFADHRLLNFGNEFPSINYQLHWKLLHQNDTLSSWVSTYAGKQYEGKSTPSNTVYKSLNNEDPTPTRIAIYEPTGNTDRKYLIAALNAIAGFTKRKIIVNPPSDKIDVGFWLSDKPVSTDFKAALREHASLFLYEKGKISSVASFINVEGDLIKLSKRIESNEQLGNLWTDGFGHPILSKERTNSLTIFHFYSRFNPQWNDLVWDEIFVKAMMPLVIKERYGTDFGFEAHPTDQRVLSMKQKVIISSNTLNKAANIELYKLIILPVWIAALLIFIVERVLSLRKKMDVKN